VSTSRIKVDLSSRSFEIEVPDEKIDDVLVKIEKLFAQTRAPGGNVAPLQTDESQTEAGEESNGKLSDKKRKRGGGSGGKTKSYQLVDLGLSPQQRQAIQEFFTEKAPSQQNDQVAVLGVKLKEFLNRDTFTGDDIHSAFKVVNKPTPRNLTAVFGNMKRDGKAGYSDNKIVINSYTDDHVQFHMKRAEPRKSKAK
jgi:hypothetical protein